jgi:hypothetical protein
MGAIGTDRARKFQERFDNWEDPMGIIPKFHYGTHYSSAGIVLYYLLRTEPFTRYAIQLQGTFFLLLFPCFRIQLILMRFFLFWFSFFLPRWQIRLG